MNSCLSLCLFLLNAFLPDRSHEVSFSYSNNAWFPLEGKDFLLVLCWQCCALMSEITLHFLPFLNPLSHTFFLAHTPKILLYNSVSKSINILVRVNLLSPSTDCLEVIPLTRTVLQFNV